MECHSSSDSQTPFLTQKGDYAEDGSVDLRGRPVIRSLTGGWKAAFFIAGVELAEKLSYFGIVSNLVSYFTNVLHQPTVSAAKNVNIWTGVTLLLPLLGAFIADEFLGRYWTILLSAALYVMGLISLTVSASLPVLRPPPCNNFSTNSCPRASNFQLGVFFFSLYLVAVAQGGFKPCLQAFGADQFDDEDPKERKYKSSLFNWWFFGLCSGTLLAVSLLTYIQDNVGWGLGFGIPTVAMAVAVSVFLCGTKNYRHKRSGVGPFTQFMRVFVAAIRKWNVCAHSRPAQNKLTHFIQEEEDFLMGSGGGLRRQLLPTNQFKFLDKATVEDDLDSDIKTAHSWRLCTVTEVEEVKLVLRLFPIWVACLMYGVVSAQCSTFFTKQGSTMDKRIGPHFVIPPASLQMFRTISILTLLPVYDRFFVPVARSVTRNERGITMLQRIGIGIFCSILCMTVAALTEMRRLKAARDNGLLDKPTATIPLSIFWLIPQYILLGTSEVFAKVGMQEFFYDQMPDTMRSLGMAVYVSVFGVGNFASSILVSVIAELSRRGGSKDANWFSDNLNRAHLNKFYWLLAGLSVLNLSLYLLFGSCFIYKNVDKKSSCHEKTSFPANTLPRAESA
eukprot:Gb_16020 [translate_table: standard]